MEFKNRIVVIGFGVVARALLPLLIKHLRVSPAQIAVIDFADRSDVLRPWIAKGLRFVHERVTASSLARLLSAHAGRGDLIIDLAWSVDFFDISAWAHENEVLYINASLESWDDADEVQRKSLVEKSLYLRYARLIGLRERRRNTTTALVDQGANPGLISAFAKAGLLDIGAAALREGKLVPATARRLERLIEKEHFALLARLLGVRAIHCSERDTQRAARPKTPAEFVNTWSVEGMWEEAVSPCELGWGTHERRLPPGAIVPQEGPGNQIIIPRMGLDVWARSWVPRREIVGRVVTHGESFGLSHLLTVRQGARVVYRPTVHFVYSPSDDACASLDELRGRNYEMHPDARILADEIVDGSDAMGALIMGHRFTSWWTGSILSIDEARKHVPGVNATAVQVATGLLASLLWMLRNPRKGICLPEDIPHGEILGIARPYLGRFVSVRSDWKPRLRRHPGAARVFAPSTEGADAWQFGNFLADPPRASNRKRVRTRAAVHRSGTPALACTV